MGVDVTLDRTEMNTTTTTTDKMAYVGQCEFNRSPVKPYNMLTIISNEPLPAELPGTPFPIKLLFKISGDWAGVIAPYRLLESVSYDLPSLDILEPFKLNIDEDDECDNCCLPKREENDEDDEVCSCDKCESCDVNVGYDNIIQHDFGCVALCEECSIRDGEPQCPRKHREGDCDWCIDKWNEIDGIKIDE